MLQWNFSLEVVSLSPVNLEDERQKFPGGKIAKQNRGEKKTHVALGCMFLASPWN